MPDNSDTDGRSTPPLVNVADGRAMVRLNRPREHNRLEPDDPAVLRLHEAAPNGRPEKQWSAHDDDL